MNLLSKHTEFWVFWTQPWSSTKFEFWFSNDCKLLQAAMWIFTNWEILMGTDWLLVASSSFGDNILLNKREQVKVGTFVWFLTTCLQNSFSSILGEKREIMFSSVHQFYDFLLCWLTVLWHLFWIFLPKINRKKVWKFPINHYTK